MEETSGQGNESNGLRETEVFVSREQFILRHAESEFLGLTPVVLHN
jgi:hypothetical protein